MGQVTWLCWMTHTPPYACRRAARHRAALGSGEHAAGRRTAVLGSRHCGCGRRLLCGGWSGAGDNRGVRAAALKRRCRLSSVCSRNHPLLSLPAVAHLILPLVHSLQHRGPADIFAKGACVAGQAKASGSLTSRLRCPSSRPPCARHTIPHGRHALPCLAAGRVFEICFHWFQCSNSTMSAPSSKPVLSTRMSTCAQQRAAEWLQ